MRFNKQELLTLATQPSHKFDREGLLYIRERQEGFFRRTDRRGKASRHERAAVGPVGCYTAKVLVERWCRLRGNLLFYFKGRDVWSEPVGVIVLEHCTIRLDPPDPLSAPPYGFTLVFEGGLGQHIGASTEPERDAWLEAIQTAGYSRMRSELLSLQQRLETKRGHRPDLDVQMWRLSRGHTIDPSEVPLCEVSLSCDNLLCDGHGRPPNPLLSVYVFLPTEAVWIKYSNTELVQRSSNPTFLCTVCFRASDGLSGDTKIRFTAFDVRESISQTSTPIGSACIELSALQDNDRLRIPLRGGKTASAGFLSISVWSLEREGSALSTESTPLRSAHHHLVWCHRRSQSLPPKLGVKLKVPHQGWFKSFFGNALVTTYRFHSGLGGDISVHEIMAESKLCFLFPQQLLSLWMNEEKELLQEVAGMGELEEPWHSVQVDLLDRHLRLLHLYSQARENLQAHKGSYFKASCRKADRSLEFAPINLHLQRIWVQNETLKKCDFYDIVTVGAFTAHAHKSKNGGLIKLLQQLKESPIKSKNGNPGVDKISTANDAIQAIKQLRREVVDGMRTLMKLAKEKKTSGMLPICDDMIAKTRALLSLWDPGLVEEALRFVEEHKVQRSAADSSESETPGESPFRRIARQLRWDSPPPERADDELATPDSPRCLAKFWHHPLNAPSPSPIHKNTTDENSNLSNLEDEEERRRLLEGEECVGGRRFLDTQAMCSSPSANYYKPSEEPEPWDLTQLNIEASVMCLVSKVKFLCGRCTSPAIRLRSGNKSLGRSQSFRSELCRGGAVTCQPSSAAQSERPGTRLHSTSDDCLTQAVQTATAVRNKFTEGLELSSLRDWTSELRPSMRKLRQAMDGLLKTARLTHSVFRLQEDRAAAQRACHVRYRRHVVFSHALTSVVTGLVSRLWCSKADPAFCVVLSKVGPLVSFESLLTYHGDEIDMWGDMVVAVEDLRTVLFTLAPPTTSRMPKVVGGCRSVVEVVLPVPEPVYSLVGAATFHVTPVLFNVGINEKATLAESLNSTGPQRKSNADNLSRLHEYYHRFSKLGLSGPGTHHGSSHSQPSLSDLVDQLRAEVLSNRSKNVRILHLAQLICRNMKGLRFTSCKSAKDRTGMSVTLEQVDILASEYDLAEHEHQRALDCMRSEGCRRENTGKNIGVRKYALNRLNLITFPAAYRPPPGTYGSKQT